MILFLLFFLIFFFSGVLIISLAILLEKFSKLLGLLDLLVLLRELAEDEEEAG